MNRRTNPEYNAELSMRIVLIEVYVFSESSLVSDPNNFWMWIRWRRSFPDISAVRVT
jgi:hypothetical protein